MGTFEDELKFIMIRSRGTGERRTIRRTATRRNAVWVFIQEMAAP